MEKGYLEFGLGILLNTIAIFIFDNRIKILLWLISYGFIFGGIGIMLEESKLNKVQGR